MGATDVVLGARWVSREAHPRPPRGRTRRFARPPPALGLLGCGTMTDMTESGNEKAPVDPKEAMRRALEAKKNAQHAHADGAGGSKSMGSTHAKAAGKRQFRRKSGG